MAKYTVRVELHNATEDNYETLHLAMQARGFLRMIQDTDTGEWFQLPTAEYNIITEVDRVVVLENAKAAATTTGRGFMVLVTPSEGRIWFGLSRAVK
jgi:hypothetical protein